MWSFKVSQLLFALHRVNMCSTTGQAIEHLHHHATTMAWNAIVQGRSVIKESISGHPLIQMRDISARILWLEMLVKRIMNDTVAVLSHFIQHCLDLVCLGPSKEGFQLL